MQLAVPVQFSGNPREYLYIVSHLTGALPEPGDRIVVPAAKFKDDGTLSLSVAMASGVPREVPDLPLLLPVVSVIEKRHLNYVASLVASAVAGGFKA